VNLTVELPLSLSARLVGWDPDARGSAVVIQWGPIDLATIPTPQFDRREGHRSAWASDGEVSAVAGEWLMARLAVAS
jgi:hypothetical protein